MKTSGGFCSKIFCPKFTCPKLLTCNVLLSCHWSFLIFGDLGAVVSNKKSVFLTKKMCVWASRLRGYALLFASPDTNFLTKTKKIKGTLQIAADKSPLTLHLKLSQSFADLLAHHHTCLQLELVSHLHLYQYLFDQVHLYQHHSPNHLNQG